MLQMDKKLQIMVAFLTKCLADLKSLQAVARIYQHLAWRPVVISSAAHVSVCVSIFFRLVPHRRSGPPPPPCPVVVAALAVELDLFPLQALLYLRVCPCCSLPGYD